MDECCKFMWLYTVVVETIIIAQRDNIIRLKPTQSTAYDITKINIEREINVYRNLAHI